uniref:Uncharacterized protein n=1 Tax=Anguilla anguilla TaxID=7936 RepID=A0A0E9PHR7_ANGAN
MCYTQLFKIMHLSGELRSFFVESDAVQNNSLTFINEIQTLKFLVLVLLLILIFQFYV